MKPVNHKLIKRILSILLMVMLLNLPIYADLSYMKFTKSFLELNNVCLSEAFCSIEKQSKYDYLYSDNIKNELNKRVVETRKLKKNEKIVTVFSAEGIKVNGTVLDEFNAPLPGVNVMIKGTTIGTTTDIDGNYFIDVPDKSVVLVFSFIGYEQQEIKVGNQINISLKMKETSTGLNEVVVVGFGSQKRASVIGSITTIAPESLRQSPTRALSNNLAGQLAGVIAVQRTGEPGKDGSTFWIRGISSFQNSGRSPLVLVDGIERTLDDMDPAEIESFSVLKDASASAVYGVRGANGVIIVNTKRGQIGKPSISLNYQQSFTQPTKLPDYINSADYLSLLNELKSDAGLSPDYTDEIINNYRNGLDVDLYPSVNWIDEVTKDYATNSRANLTINGGSDILRYALIASYYGENGIFERDKSQSWDSSIRLNKYNVRSNVDVNITKSTIARVSIGGYLQEGNGMAVSGDDVFNAAFETTPFVHPAVYSSGEFPRVKQRQNPWVMATQHGFSTSSSSKIESLFSLEQDFGFWLKGLKVKGLFSFDRYSTSGIKRSKSPDYYNPATSRDEEGNLNLNIGDYGQMFLGTEQIKSWGDKATYLEGNISYSGEFGKNHVDAMFMYNQRDYQNGDVVPFRRMGIAGRASYMYDSKYIAEFNFGYNGSENFSKGNRFGFFPSLAIGYLLSEEKFMEKYKETFSKIKLRGSWGKVGNDQLSGRRFAYITTVNFGGNYIWGVNNDYYRGGRFEGDFGIPNLTWETVEKINLGLEFGLWNAIEIQVDWFNEHRRNIFMQRNTIPTAAGFIKTPWANFGKVDNKGIDISLTANKQINDKLYLGFRGTFTYAKNKIIEIDEAPGILGTNRSRTGKPVNQLFGLVADRLFTEDDFENIEKGILKEDVPTQSFNQVRPGDIKYVDIDGDGSITPKDQTAIGGTYDPQLVYGFGANASYKNFDLSMFFQGNGKTWRFIGGSYFIPGSTMGTMGNILDNYNNRWTLENPNQNVFYPRLSYGPNENNSQNSTWWLRNMSMLRLKDIELGYRFPQQLTNQIGIKNLRIYLKCANLLTISNFRLWDPEVDTPNGAKYPVMKSVSFGLDVNF